MSRRKIQSYYQETRNTKVRPALEFAFSILPEGTIAVDCGCGAGANIVHLRNAGYIVHAYDVDEDAVSLCANRFKDDKNVFVSLASFGTFDYPKASLVLADASLFYCSEHELGTFVEKIRVSLSPGGLFCGAFLGLQDTMAQPENKSAVYWGRPLVKTKTEIREVLSAFEILKMSEIISDGVTTAGEVHHWHIHTVVARAI